jgi:transcriptional regulator with XRE-family HTH domain
MSRLPKAVIHLKEEEINNLPQTLWDLRTTTGITQGQVAKDLGKQQSYISQIENPEKPKIAKLETLIPYLKAIKHKLVIIPSNAKIIIVEE